MEEEEAQQRRKLEEATELAQRRQLEAEEAKQRMEQEAERLRNEHERLLLEAQEAMRSQVEAEQEKKKQDEADKMRIEAEEAEKLALAQFQKEEEERQRAEELAYMQEVTRQQVLQEIEADRVRMIEEEKAKKEEELLRNEREKLVEELRLAHVEREEEEQRHQEEMLQAEYDANEAKRLEELRVEEHERLLEELRLAKLAQAEEENARDEERQWLQEKDEEIKREEAAREEAREQEMIMLAEEMEAAKQTQLAEMEAREQEMLAIAEEMELTKQSQREELELRKRTLAEVEEKAKAAEEGLMAEKQILDNESRLMEQMRMTAEEKVNAVEEARMDAELEASDMMEKMRLAADEEALMMEQMRLAAEENISAVEEARIDAEHKASDMIEEMHLATEENVSIFENARIETEKRTADSLQFHDESEREMENYAEQAHYAEMAKKAEMALIYAEERATSAEQTYTEAEKAYTDSKQLRRNAQGRMVQRSSLAVQDELAEEKDILLEEADRAQQDVRDAQKEVDKLNRLLQEGQDIEPVRSQSSAENLATDWALRKENSRKNLADHVMRGWSMIPEYCSGRMCNFSPLLQDGDQTHCVICEGSGTGADGAYAKDDDNEIDYIDTMSFVEKKEKYETLNNKSKKGVLSSSVRESGSKEVGRRILEGWQLLESPCPVCMNPLMSEFPGAPEVCVFCDPDDDVEIGDEDDFRDDASRGSVSITLEIPDDFDASDPAAMSELIQNATRGINPSRSRSRGRDCIPTRRDSPDPASSRRSRSRQNLNRSGGSVGPRGLSPRNRLPPSTSSGTPRGKYQQQGALLPPRHQFKSTPPRLTPESRLTDHNRPRSNSCTRSRSRPQPRSLSRSRPSEPMMPSSHVVVPDTDNDDASFLTEDRSMATNTLDAIFSQIDTYKDQLNEPLDTTDTESYMAGMEKRNNAASLIEKLSAAASAVRNVESSS